MSRFHDEFLWLDQTYLITKKLMRVITILSDFGASFVLKLAKNKNVVELIGATCDERSLSITSAKNKVVKYLSMMIGNKIYFINQHNFTYAMMINTTYGITELNKDFEIWNIETTIPRKPCIVQKEETPFQVWNHSIVYFVLFPTRSS